MIRSRTARSWIALLALASFAVPAVGAHLHLCLDGSEAPTSVHVAEVGGLHSQSEDSGHHDVDVGLGLETLAKKGGSAPDALKVLPTAPVLYVRPLAVAIGVVRATPTPSVRSVHYRIAPPPRGPPV
jgi:hypothetical protein